MSALSRARLYSDEARCGESVAAAPIGPCLPTDTKTTLTRAIKSPRCSVAGAVQERLHAH